MSIAMSDGLLGADHDDREGNRCGHHGRLLVVWRLPVEPAAGASSVAIANRWPAVERDVRAPFRPGPFCSTSNVVRLFSLTMVTLPRAERFHRRRECHAVGCLRGSLKRILPSFALE
jgi:hypothetical protein